MTTKEYDAKKAAQRAKWKASIVKRYGSWEAYLAQVQKWGAEGGHMSGHITGTPGGFRGFTPEERSAAGKKGYQVRVNKLREEIRNDSGREDS